MKKILSLLMMALLCVTTAWAAETIVFSDIYNEDTALDGETISSTNGFFSVTFSKGTNNNQPKYFANGTAIRIYGGGYFVVSSSTKTITKIELTFGSGDGSNTITTDVGTYSNGIWTGSSQSVKFSIGGTSGHRRIAAIAVTYSSGGGTPTVAAPTFSPDPEDGPIEAGSTITISAETGAEIYYTDDGLTTPTSDSNHYTGPITINQNTTFKAIAIKEGVSSDVTTAAYTISSGTSLGSAMILFDTNEIGINQITQTGTRPFMKQIVSESQQYVSSVTNISNCWGKDGGIRISTTSAAGSFTLNFSSLVTGKKVSQIIVNAKGWTDSENGEFGLTGITSSNITVSGTTLKDYTINVNPSQKLSSLTVQGVGGKRTVIQSITLIFDDDTPTPSGPEYYLVGSFNMNGNDWVEQDETYIFSESNGTYTLSVESLPACSFKILKVDGNTKTWYGFKEGEANIHHNNHENIPTGGLGNEPAFNLQSEAYTEFSFTLDASNYNNPKFTVTRTPKLYIQGFGEWDANVAMTQTSTGWTISKTINQYQQFRFIDEFGQRQGWTGGDYGINDINGTIPIAAGDNVFQMNVDGGDFILNVNSEVTTLNIKKAIKYQLITSTDALDPSYNYIVVGKTTTSTYVMGKTLNNGRANRIAVTPDADGKIAATDDMAIITLGGVTDAWTLHTTEGYLASAGDGKMMFSGNPVTATIDFGEDDDTEAALIDVSNNTTYSRLKHNVSSQWFAFYKPTSGTAIVYLYKSLIPSNKSAAPAISPESGDVYGLKQQVEITPAPNVENCAIYYTTDGTTPTENSTLLYEGPFTVTATQYGQQITVTAIAIETVNGEAKVPSNPVSSTYKFIAPINRTLAQIEASGNPTGKTYTVTDDLQVVYVNSTKDFAIARDLTENTVNCPSEYVDFMSEVVTDVNDQQVGPWQDNNWVMLDFTDENADLTDVSINGIIQGGTLTGVYTDNNNYTIKVSGNVTCTEGSPYVPNVYSPANFYGDHTQTGPIVNEEPVTYWFKTPKVMEVCKFTYAMYYAGEYGGVTYAPGFYMQEGDEYALKGGVGLDLSYNSANPELVNGESYRFTGVIMKTGQTSGAKDAAQNHHPQSDDFNSEFKVAATDLTKTQGQVITAVSEVKTGSDVVSVTYCDLAGRMSQKPFAGVNIIVTRYSDGTVKTTKAIK